MPCTGGRYDQGNVRDRGVHRRRRRERRPLCCRRGADLRHGQSDRDIGQTLTLQTTAKGKTRDVTIVLKPESKIVKFARPSESGKTGFVEQTLALTDIKPGWVVSVTAKHEGGKEVAEIVKVVLEK